MRRFFNIAGPCDPRKHYMLPAQGRLTGLGTLIDQEQYFVIHAARQSGKTTLLLDLVNELNDGDDYIALYVSLEAAQGIEDPEAGLMPVARAIVSSLEYHPLLSDIEVPEKVMQGPLVIASLFRYLCAKASRPIVVLCDEADCLSGQTLITFLRQIRDGYINRLNRIPFPQSLALVGLRSIRDYKAEIHPESKTLGSASPFNIVTESMTLRCFTREEMSELYGQHTQATGQSVPDEVLEYLMGMTGGQPWLVNAVIREVIIEKLEGDFSRKISRDDTEEAIHALVRRRDTHIDSLLERLKEPRVRKVIEPVILGAVAEIDALSDDVRYVVDLGLLVDSPQGYRPANPIYAEVIGRYLSWSTQKALPVELENRWFNHGLLDMSGLLREFQQFWRENSDIWVQKYDYREAAPHLILMAFLQRSLNGGAKVDREFASGTGRTDLNVRYGGRHHPLEIKLWRGPKSRTEAEEQILGYCTTLGASEGWVVIFDRRPERTWDERIWWETVKRDGKILHIVGG